MTWRAEKKLAIEFVPAVALALLRSLFLVHPRTEPGTYFRALVLAIALTVLRRRIHLPSDVLRRSLIVEYRGLRYVVTPETVFAYYLSPFEPATRRLMEEMSGELFVDIGANVGQYSVPLSRRFRRVIAVEPNPVAVRLLHENLSQNGITNVQVIQEAIAPNVGPIRLYQGTFLSTWSTATPSAVHITVPGTTLDLLLGPFDRVDLLKMDIESAERAILRSPVKALEKVSAMVFETELDSIGAEILRTLESQGFSVRIIGGLIRTRENVLAIRIPPMATVPVP